MAFLSIHTMEGDPEDLLARKRQHVDPVTERLAPAFGALMSITSRTKSGIRAKNAMRSVGSLSFMYLAAAPVFRDLRVSPAGRG